MVIGQARAMGSRILRELWPENKRYSIGDSADALSAQGLSSDKA